MSMSIYKHELKHHCNKQEVNR